MPGMDEISTRKLAEDFIFRQSLNAPRRIQQRAVSSSRIQTLKQEGAVFRGWDSRIGLERKAQRDVVFALNRDMVKFRYSWGAPDYSHKAPPEVKSLQDAEALKNLSEISKALRENSTEWARLQREEAEEAAREKALLDKNGGAPGVVSLADWFARYGSPKRQANPEERYLTLVRKPRRRPFEEEPSAARTLRLGSAVWSLRDEPGVHGSTAFRNRLTVRGSGGLGPTKSASTGSMRASSAP